MVRVGQPSVHASPSLLLADLDEEVIMWRSWHDFLLYLKVLGRRCFGFSMLRVTRQKAGSIRSTATCAPNGRLLNVFVNDNKAKGNAIYMHI